MVTATLRKAGAPAPSPNAAPAKAGGLAGQLTNRVATPVADLEIETTTTFADDGPLPPAPARAVAIRQADTYADANDGFDQDDIKLATLKIVAGSGPLSQKFNVGTLILGDEVLFEPPNLREGAVNPSLRFIPLAMKKQWREAISEEDYAQGVQPRIANSVAEVEQLGGNTQWLNGVKPSWGKSARCVFLVEEPEGTEATGFTIQIGEKRYALAVFYAAGTSYKESAQVIFNSAQMWPRDSETGRLVWHKRVWTMKVSKKPSGSFTVWVPNLQLTKEDTGPEIAEMAAKINGTASAIMSHAE